MQNSRRFAEKCNAPKNGNHVYEPISRAIKASYSNIDTPAAKIHETILCVNYTVSITQIVEYFKTFIIRIKLVSSPV